MFAVREQKITFVDTLVQKACKMPLQFIKPVKEESHMSYTYTQKLISIGLYWGILKNQRHMAGKEK